MIRLVPLPACEQDDGPDIACSGWHEANDEGRRNR